MAKTPDEDFAMKHLKICLTLLALATAFACESADAGHVRVFVGVGVPFYYPVAPIPYYYQPVVAVPVAPANYIEQGLPSAGPGQSSGSWYYCDASKAYYPYVKQCPGEWRQVSPRPASSR
jgi:hypothetical protein